MLSYLLQEMAKLLQKKDIKIRLLYTHPAHYDDRLIEIVSKNPVICPYLDIPLQHISDNILKRMNRKISKIDILKLIEKLRDKIPDLVIRTTLIVGFPGETEEDFQQLYDFIEKYHFERVGTFSYHNEEECAANKLSGHISKKIKKLRLEKLMSLQQKISLELNSSKIGKEKRVLIDEVSQENDKVLIGRSCSEAPEIDGHINVSGGNYSDIGKWIDVKITKAYPYNLDSEKICK
jgi:ribosomal protein S12 methylthiotransferase